VFFELTDYLTCPRCGPAFGLVLLVRDVKDRRVRNGWLGCSNCREDYPVHEGVADLRLDRDAAPPARLPLQDSELAIKVLALSGMAEERGCLMIDEPLAHAASRIVELAPQLEVIAVSASADDIVEQAGVSRVLADQPFPLVEHKLRCVAITPRGESDVVTAAARLVASGGRLLLFDASPSDVDEATRAGLRIVAAEGGTAVAERRPDSLPVVG
jgi:uncharacterized protein YbaR (Trm112 family)